MKQAIRPFAVAGIFWWVIIIHNACTPRLQKVPFDGSKTSELDTYVTELQQLLPIPALGVVVIKGNAVYHQSAGEAKRVAGIVSPVLDSSPFFTGSLSGLMVVTGILRLAEEGKLDTEDAVVKHLPYFRLGDSDVSQITISHLMSQTGGVPHHAILWDYPDYSDDALANTTRSIQLQQAEFMPPGSRIRRSPYNYDILADLISKVSGMPFEDYMQTNVLEPLGMSHSFFPKNSRFTDRVAQPHTIKNWLTYAMDTVVTYPANREHSGSMGWHASLQDLSSWLFMILHKGKTMDGQRFLVRRSGQMLHTHYPVDSVTAIGFGWEIAQVDGELVYSHYHDMGGFTAHAMMIPEQQVAVAVVSNIAGDFNAQAVSSQLAQWLVKDIPLERVKPLLATALGKKLETTGNVDSVVQLYETLKANAPDAYDYSLESLSQLGVNLLYRIQDLQGALQFFERCVQLFPQSALSQLNLAEAHFGIGHMDDARAALASALAMDGQDGNSIKQRVTILNEALESDIEDNEPTSYNQ